MQHKFTVGDYEGEGHRNSATYFIDIPAQFTADVLAENYAKSVAHFGFTPNEAFDDLVFTPEAYKVLLAEGFTFDASNSTDYAANREKLKGNKYLFVTDVSQYFGGEERWEDACEGDAIIKVTLFFMGYGLDGFHWVNVDKNETNDINRILGGINLGYDNFSDN